MTKRIDETSSSGATSAGSIATVVGGNDKNGLNYSLLTRVPKPEFKGYTEYKTKEDKKSTK